jgi:hypothetical protein
MKILTEEKLMVGDLLVLDTMRIKIRMIGAVEGAKQFLVEISTGSSEQDNFKTWISPRSMQVALYRANNTIIVKGEL